jgi:hypothetical protein
LGARSFTPSFYSSRRNNASHGWKRHIWLGNKINLEELRIPEGFEVVSGGEIEKFIQQRKQQSK